MLFLSDWGKRSCSLCIFASPPPVWIAVLGRQSSRKYTKGASKIKTDVCLSSHSEIKGFLSFYGCFNLSPCDLRTDHFGNFFFIINGHVAEHLFSFLKFGSTKNYRSGCFSKNCERSVDRKPDFLVTEKESGYYIAAAAIWSITVVRNLRSREVIFL